jgi:hypothetical protein
MVIVMGKRWRRLEMAKLSRIIPVVRKTTVMLIAEHKLLGSLFAWPTIAATTAPGQVRSIRSLSSFVQPVITVAGRMMLGMMRMHHLHRLLAWWRKRVPAVTATTVPGCLHMRLLVLLWQASVLVIFVPGLVVVVYFVLAVSSLVVHDGHFSSRPPLPGLQSSVALPADAVSGIRELAVMRMIAVVVAVMARSIT